MSEYFEKNRQSYYDSLNGISKNGNWEGWICYFLKAVTEQSGKNLEKVESILKLQNDMLDKVQDITHSQYTHKVVEFLLSNPFFDTLKFRKQSKVPKTNTARILGLLWENKVISIVKKGSGRSPNAYVFPALLKIIS